MPPAGERAPVAAANAFFAAALTLALVETAYVMVFSAPSFEGVLERLAFLTAELGLLAPVAALLGVLVLAFAAATRNLGVRARASLLAVLAAPACAYVGWAAFLGPSARTIPYFQLWAACIGWLGLVAVYLVVRWAPLLLERARAGQRRFAALGLVLVLFTLEVADQRILPRLYPFFHRGLEAGAILVAALLATLLANAPRRSLARTVGLYVLAALVGAGAATMLLKSGRALVTILADRAPAAATLARLYPRASTSAPKPATPDALDRTRDLPPGPHLGARDLVLVTIDAWRADRLSAEVAPNAYALAQRGVRFLDAYTQVPHTSFSVATLLTGKYVYALSALGLDAAGHETLAQVLRRERYKTAAFFPPAVFFIDHERLLPLEKSAYGFEYVKYEYMDAHRRTDQIIDFYEREKPAHAFVWVHYLEPHEPYEVHPGYTAGTPGAPVSAAGLPPAQVRYEGEIRYVDAELGRLFDYLRRTRPGALVVLAADHGEEFGEHGGRYHGTTLFDEQVRVPLVFAPVSGPPLGPRAVRGSVGLVDVAPTVLALLGVTSSAKMRGHDLSPWMAASAPPPSSLLGPIFGEIDRKKMVIDGDDKLVCDLETGACALYDRAQDPGEHRDATVRAPEVAARLRALLDRFLLGETRYERRVAAPNGMEPLFERARLGDAAVVPALAAALPQLDAHVRPEVLRMLSVLPADPASAAELAQLTPAPDEVLLVAQLRARLGDRGARAQLTKALAEDQARPDGDERKLTPEAYARAALATGATDALIAAIGRTEDRDLVILLADALARTRDPRALDALLIALAPVRSRAEVALAIGALGDPRAAEQLARWLPNDPYVPVRAAMVRALGMLHADSGVGRDALLALAATEREGPVLVALAEVLPVGHYGAIELAPVAAELKLAPAQEAIVVASGEGEVRVEGAHPVAPSPVVDGIVRLLNARGHVRVSAGLTPRLVLVRPLLGAEATSRDELSPRAP